MGLDINIKLATINKYGEWVETLVFKVGSPYPEPAFYSVQNIASYHFPNSSFG